MWEGKPGMPVSRRLVSQKEFNFNVHLKALIDSPPDASLFIQHMQQGTQIKLGWKIRDQMKKNRWILKPHC